MTQTPRILKPALAIVALGALGFGLTGCSAVKSLIHRDAWAVTYELTVDSAEPVILENVTYDTQEERGEEITTVSAGSVATSALDDDSASIGWQQDALLEVEFTAAITADAPDGVSATCRVLLDGTREIAKQTGEPGGTVTCEVETPRFEE